MARRRNEIVPGTSLRFGRGPLQFRTRNDLTEAQRTRSNRGENALKSTKLIDILPLITVWLQVRVLPGPPAFARFASFGLGKPVPQIPSEASEGCLAEARKAKADRCHELRLGKPTAPN